MGQAQLNTSKETSILWEMFQAQIPLAKRPPDVKRWGLKSSAFGDQPTHAKSRQNSGKFWASDEQASFYQIYHASQALW